MANPNNPAARLAVIMGDLRAQEPNEQIRAGLSNVLGVSIDEDPETFFRVFGRLVALPAEVEAAVRRTADPEHDSLDLYLMWQRPITRALRQAQTLVGKNSQVIGEYENDHVNSLRFCTALLSKAGVESRVDTEHVADLRRRVDELQEQILDADGIPADLKTFLLNQLDRIRFALREFTIRGPQAMADVLEQLLGAAMTHSDLIGDANEESQSVVQKFGELIDLVDRIGKAAKSIGTGIITNVGAAAAITALISGSPLPTAPALEAPPAAVQHTTGDGSADASTPQP